MHLLAKMIGQRALVIKEKTINLDGPCFIRLVGRKAGIISWFLTLIGINTTTTFEVYVDRVEYSSRSLSGKSLELIPLSKVSNLNCCRFTPIIWLVDAAVAIYFAYKTRYYIILVLAAIFVLFYFLKKTTLISITPNSGSSTSIAFKRSIIEAQGISDEEAQEIIKMVAVLVENANKR